MTQDSKKRAKVFSVVNQKGGVGKTTTVVNVATSLALMKKKTLVLDFDPQGNASTAFGIYQDQRQKTMYDALIGRYTMKEVIIPHKTKGLHIATSTVDLTAAEIELVDVKNREFCLKNAIEEVIYDYDCIIIDCPPSLGLLTINALVASDRVLIPMQCEFFSLEGLSHLLTSLDLIKENLNFGLKISGIILTMHDKRNKLTEQVEMDVREFLQDKVYVNSVPRNVRLSEAPSHGIPGVVYEQKSSGAQAYIRLTKEIIKRELTKKPG